MHGSAWQTVCGMLNTDACGVYVAWHFRWIKEEQVRSMFTCEDIVPVDIMEQIERWGHQIPSLSQRSRLEKRLIKKYSKMRVFSVHDRIYHNKFGDGTVLDTMPDENKQFLYVKFDNGETRTVQNRQVYKVVNGKVQKPSLKKKAS